VAGELSEPYLAPLGIAARLDCADLGRAVAWWASFITSAWAQRDARMLLADECFTSLLQIALDQVTGLSDFE